MRSATAAAKSPSVWDGWPIDKIPCSTLLDPVQKKDCERHFGSAGGSVPVLAGTSTGWEGWPVDKIPCYTLKDPVQQRDCERHFGSAPHKRQKTDPVLAPNARDDGLSPVHPFHSKGNVEDNTGANNGAVEVGTWDGKPAAVKYAQRVNPHGIDIKKEIKFLKYVARLCRPRSESSHRDGGCQHVVTFYDIAEKYDPPGTKLYGIVMEYLNGGTLQKHRLDPNRWEYVAQVRTGLAFLHRNGIIHCDVKPDNIMLHRGGNGTTRAVLTDLGLAVRRGEKIIAQFRGFQYLGIGAPATENQDLYQLLMTVYVLLHPGANEFIMQGWTRRTLDGFVRQTYGKEFAEAERRLTGVIPLQLTLFGVP